MGQCCNTIPWKCQRRIDNFFSNNLKLNLKLVMQIYEKYFVSGIYCRN